MRRLLCRMFGHRFRRSAYGDEWCPRCLARRVYLRQSFGVVRIVGKDE